jgi:hypothetical protein
VLVYWGLLCLSAFLWGKVSDLSACPLLSECCDGLLIVFQFHSAFDFGCCLLAQEVSFVDCYLLYFRQWFITGPLSVLLTFQLLFTESSRGDYLLAPPPFSIVLSAFLPPLLCASFQFLVYCSGFFFAGAGQSVEGAMLVYPRGGWGNAM